MLDFQQVFMDTLFFQHDLQEYQKWPFNYRTNRIALKASKDNSSSFSRSFPRKVM